MIKKYVLTESVKKSNFKSLSDKKNYQIYFKILCILLFLFGTTALPPVIRIGKIFCHKCIIL